ncbi:SAM-dependent methyltransferase [Candidatus Mycobacterium wuenschmannii]|uniref:S-adenosyl-L-methionine-dependent methyltransferase n=1 Tax=Candidatus Mycobacterium wuenschmannii TaxID=3027808 RepID=A0ABY8VUD8_9MYCO|nr:SAM-dependent methyltransferase [Candidatus Mycobacterium wuenschmannii]WIM87245.1 SAM-dependent methyltransferase [Candidatus Mycobacterium wuenschmannii]
MARTDNDSWDITESVGATALGVAMARAAESDCGCPLFIDRYAQLFVDAAVARGWDPSDVGRHLPLVQNYAAARTKWFDEYFIAAGANGIDQAVILAAGLDARAWRLPWVSGTVVYEIDQPQVLAFKAETLGAHKAHPACGYRAVPIDLRADWPTALQEAGFDPSTPTAWSAEGLLPYLPPVAQDLLFERILKLSAPGSRIAAEALSPNAFDADYLERGRQALGDGGQDLTDLLFKDDRADIRQWLTDRDWAVTEVAALDLMRRFDRMPAEALADVAPRSVFVEGRLHAVAPLRYCES